MTPIFFLTLVQMADPVLDPQQPIKATPSESVAYDIDYRVTVTAPSGTKQLKVWLPIPSSDLGQTISNIKIETFPIPVTPARQAEPVYGNEFAHFVFDNPQGGQIIALKFQAKVSQLHWNLDHTKVARVSDWPKSFDPYRRSEKYITLDKPFGELAKTLTAGANDPAVELDRVMDWIRDNLTYDGPKGSRVADSVYALTNKTGHCSDYHGLCSSLGRSLGVPTRVVYGLQAFPKNSPHHCKMEAFLPPYGWVNYDISETQKLTKLIASDKGLSADDKKTLQAKAIDRLRSGFRDNTWIRMTVGTDYDLAPPAKEKVPLISTIYAEADGKALPTPDPGNPAKQEFSWITSHSYKANRKVSYPFADWKTLK